MYFIKGVPGMAIPLRILAPTIFFVAILWRYERFLSGTGNDDSDCGFTDCRTDCQCGSQPSCGIFPHSGISVISQYGGLRCGRGNTWYSNGCIDSINLLIVLYLIYRPTFARMVAKDRVSKRQYDRDIYRTIALTMIPIILGQTFYQISAVIDDMMFSNMMIGTDITKSITTDMGNFNSSYSLLIGIPQGVASAMSASMLPSIVASYTQGEIGAVRKKIKETLKTNMFIAIPSFVGLFVLGKPIIQLLFARYDSTQGGMMLKIGAIAVVFYTLSTVTSSALQGIDEMSTPVKHSCISLVVHIILVFVLLKFSRLGIYAIVIGNASFPIIIFILNIISLYRHIGYRMEYRQTFIVPAVCALSMGVAAGLVYDGMIKLTASNILSLMAAFIAAGIFYFGPLFVAKKKKWY